MLCNTCIKPLFWLYTILVYVCINRHVDDLDCAIDIVDKTADFVARNGKVHNHHFPHYNIDVI